MADEVRQLEWWKKAPISHSLADRFRDILQLPAEDELPESLHLTMAMRSAIDRGFVEDSLSLSDMVDIIMHSQYLSLLKTKSEIEPGSTITIRSQQRQAVYVCPGPLGRDLVNRYGMYFLVEPKDIEADDAARINSELNLNAAAAAELIGATGYNPKRRHMEKVTPPAPEVVATH